MDPMEAVVAVAVVDSLVQWAGVAEGSARNKRAFPTASRLLVGGVWAKISKHIFIRVTVTPSFRRPFLVYTFRSVTSTCLRGSQRDCERKVNFNIIDSDHINPCGHS